MRLIQICKDLCDALAITTTQTSGVFPFDTLPLFEATVDSVNLIRNLLGWRPSYI